MTGSAENLPIDLTPGPITCPTEDHHVSLIELACCTITITILNADRSWMTQVLDWNAMHGAHVWVKGMVCTQL